MAEHVAQDQRGSLARRQHLHRGEERQLDGLPPDDHRVGLILGRQLVEEMVGIGLQPGDLRDPRQFGELARPTA